MITAVSMLMYFKKINISCLIIALNRKMSNISFVVRKFDNTENEKYVFSDFHFLDCVCVLKIDLFSRVYYTKKRK